jgi:HAD superfamily hydrolase (TIGR01549 family)
MSRFFRSRIPHQRFSHVVFDLDGTLTKPGAINFHGIRKRCNVPSGIDILAHIESHIDEEKRRELHKIVEEEEHLGLQRLELQDHCDELFDFLNQQQVKSAILTRNNDTVMMKSLEKMKRGSSAFHILVSRSFTPTKPSPEPLYHIAQTFGIQASDLIMVGDSIDDIACAKNAGSFAILIGNESSVHFNEALSLADATISTLKELQELFELLLVKKIN